MSKPANQESKKLMTYVLIGLTILFTVCGQLLVKSATSQFGQFPSQFSGLLPFLIKAYTNFKLLAGLSCAVITSITWMGALSTSNISFAYPFMGLAFVLVLTLSPLAFKESIPWTRWLGVGRFCVGLWVASK